MVTKMMKVLVRAAVLLVLCALAKQPALAQEKSGHHDLEDDAVLQAMRDELERARGKLKLEHVAAPYYIEYRVVDVEDFTAQASFGALHSAYPSRARMIQVVVRVGDYKEDGTSGRGERVLNLAELVPLDNDSVSLRQPLWLATDRAYTEAVAAFTAKQAQLKTLTIDQPVNDFALATPVYSVKTLAKLDVDPKPYTRMLEDASAVFKSDPQVQVSDASLRFEAVNRYFLNSEGTAIRDGRNLYTMVISCSTQASDGMSLQRNNGFVVDSVGKLPTAAAFRARAEELAQTLKDLRNAPVVDEEYRGPVLLSADAADTIFYQLIGENVLGRRPDLGKTGRTTGAFATSYKSRVLPDFMSVVDDPTISSYRDHPLIGHYEIDDEGVPAQRVAVIEKGNLTNYLIGREPIRDFPASNGHARARIPGGVPAHTHAMPHIGNLIVSASQTSTPDELMKKFLDLCRQRELPYCYYVQTFGPKFMPRLLYKVWTKDGHKELVRGGVFGDLDTRALRNNLIAAGDDVFVDEGPLNVPYSIAAPSALFDELEVNRAPSNREKLPEYPAPAVGAAR